ncbi:unnamed protein product [Amoebophrya sp. A25]|nr:unnamed protein product [Amoebophrya sp. A25]|eukprot:GSA25T00000745001.1
MRQRAEADETLSNGSKTSDGSAGGGDRPTRYSLNQSYYGGAVAKDNMSRYYSSGSGPRVGLEDASSSGSDDELGGGSCVNFDKRGVGRDQAGSKGSAASTKSGSKVSSSASSQMTDVGAGSGETHVRSSSKHSNQQRSAPSNYNYQDQGSKKFNSMHYLQGGFAPSHGEVDAGMSTSASGSDVDCVHSTSSDEQQPTIKGTTKVEVDSGLGILRLVQKICLLLVIMAVAAFKAGQAAGLIVRMESGVNVYFDSRMPLCPGETCGFPLSIAIAVASAILMLLSWVVYSMLANAKDWNFAVRADKAASAVS